MTRRPLPVLSPAATEHIKTVNLTLRARLARLRATRAARAARGPLIAELTACGWSETAAHELADIIERTTP